MLFRAPRPLCTLRSETVVAQLHRACIDRYWFKQIGAFGFVVLLGASAGPQFFLWPFQSFFWHSLEQ